MFHFIHSTWLTEP